MELKLEHVNKSFKDQCIFQNMNISFSKTGFYLIFGESGSGKTTLLHMLAGHECIDKGMRFLSEGLTITSVLQHHELIDFMNVKDNICLQDSIYHDVDPVYMQEIITKLRIDHILYHYPNELSEGQKQRVCIARGLLQNSSIILCDEPTEALDQGNKKIVLDILYELSKTKCVIIATHDDLTLHYENAIVYGIENHNLYLKNENFEQSRQEISIDQNRGSYDFSFLHMLIKNILFYKKAFYLPVLCIITCILLLLNLYITSIFTIDISNNQLGQNQIYIHSYDHKAVNGIKSEFKTLRAVPEITSINISYLQFNSDIHLLDEEIHIDSSSSNQLIIPVTVNDVLTYNLEKNLNLETVIGEPILIQYKIGLNRGVIEGVIVDIIQDSNQIGSVYFHEEQLYRILKKLNSQTGTGTLYDDLLADSTDYIGILNTDHIIETYQRMKEMNGFTVMNRELDEHQKRIENQGPYQMIYLILEIVLGIVLAVFILYENNQIMKKIASHIALLSTMGIPMKDIKNAIYKVLGSRILMLLVCNIVICISFSVFMNITLGTFLPSLILLIMVVLFYIGTWLLFDHVFKNVQVAYMMIYAKD